NVMKKKLPIGVSNLRKIITEGYHYVDKTRYVYELVETGVYYFLSRPRRFGKTLFVDTLKEAFEGNKELFKGLYIYDKWDWEKTYPVIHINFAKGEYSSSQDLKKRILKILGHNQKRLDIECEDTEDIAGCFDDLIELSKEKYGCNVVILIDEYDKPILDALPNIELAKEMREGLKNLYSVIKGQDANIKFVFMTGVSKFSKVSLFSGLNNLEDITINETYSSICGYTEEELQRNFTEYLVDKDIELIRKWYNGYSWTGAERVYNPYGILNYLKTGVFKNYWFETGTPTFLIELFKEKRYYIPQMDEMEVGESLISSFEIENLDVETVLFQAGYLTIKSHRFDGANNWYKLEYPNHEVKGALTEYILRHYTTEQREVSANRINLLEALKRGEVERIREIIQSHFASIPNEWYRKNRISEYEGYYGSVFYSYFASIGVEIRVEDATSKGRVDMVVIMSDKVLIFEFKVIKGEAEVGSAIRQIREKRYLEKYESLNLPIYLIGIEFDKEERNIKNFQWEKGK
ncbi:MAG: ATP-binding protein, partial [Thermodesulfovibrionales bacterium]|nr:ATP-binding protein [Thermodesulfovibrionales bacterium]